MSNINCQKCGQHIGPLEDRNLVRPGYPPLYAHTKCPEPTPNLDKFVAFADRLSKEPELSLLIIDLGDSCVVKVEKGDPAAIFSKIIVSAYRENVAIIHVPLSGFESVKASIDALDSPEAEPPVPRIEHREDIHGNWWYWLWHQADVYSAIELKHYDALCKVAGVTIPVWEPKKGTWTRLPSTAEYMGDPLEGVGIQIWRYAR